MKSLSSSVYNFLQPLLLFGILVSLGSLLFYSCKPEKTVKAQKLVLATNCFLAKKICEPNQTWLNADSSNLITYFSIYPDSPRVLSFQINSADVDSILQISAAAKDSVLFRVYMSLNPFSSLDSNKNNEPTFRPILYLVNTQKNALQSSTAFAMDYVDINILAYLANLPEPNISVNAKKAKQFITRWDALAQDSVYNTFYENAVHTDTGRVRFYTFIGDTEPIIDTLKKYPEDLIYLHLGVHYETDSIPFRTIIHIDNPDNFADSITVTPGNPPLFEFASPCPKFCKD